MYIKPKKKNNSKYINTKKNNPFNIFFSKIGKF